MPIEYIFLGRKPLWWLCGTATLTISFCPFAFTGKARALIYVIDLQFQCSVVTFQVLRKCVFWPLQRPIEYIFLRRQPLWWLCGQLHQQLVSCSFAFPDKVRALIYVVDICIYNSDVML